MPVPRAWVIWINIYKLRLNQRPPFHWRDDQSRRSLERSIYQKLLKSGQIARSKLAELATRIVELARNRHRWLVWDGKNKD